MRTDMIDTAMAKRMVEADAIHGASIIGQPGGWAVVLKLGTQETTLAAQRSDKPRTWRSLDRCVEYLKKELHLARFELLDATNYAASLTGMARVDASMRLRDVHQAAAHDKWFRAQVEQGLREADAPDAEWLSHDAASTSWESKRAELVKRAESRGV